MSNEYSSNKYDGTRQKVLRILNSMQEDSSGDKSAPKPFLGHFEENTMDITNVIEKVAVKGRERVQCKPHQPAWRRRSLGEFV